MLLNEAKIYNAFPRNLQDGDAPIVPKFYGYYVPSTEASDLDDSNHGDADGLDKEKWKAVRKALLGSNTSILLVEACGKPVGSCSLTGSARWALDFYKIIPDDEWKGANPLIFCFGKQAGHRETFETSTQSQLHPGILIPPQHPRAAWPAHVTACQSLARKAIIPDH